MSDPYEHWSNAPKIPEHAELIVHRVVPHYLGGAHQVLVYWTHVGERADTGHYSVVDSKAMQDHLVGHAYGWGLPAKMFYFRLVSGELAVHVEPVFG